MNPGASWNAANGTIIPRIIWNFRNNLCFLTIVLSLLSVYGSIFIIYTRLFKFVLLSSFLFPSIMGLRRNVGHCSYWVLEGKVLCNIHVRVLDSWRRKKFASSPSPYRSGAHPSSYSVCTGALYSGSKVAWS